jgi:dethiobiotin synthetase
MSAFVVTGTASGIGKTVFSAALTGALGAHYWKPMQVGSASGADRDTVAQLSGLCATQTLPETYRLTRPLSPHHAAEMEGVEIDPDRLALPDVRPLVIEGTGGVLTPMTREVTCADIFAEWGLLTIIVSPTGRDSINESLLTIEALRARRVPIHGVAFVGEANGNTETTIAEMGQVRRLGRLPH